MYRYINSERLSTIPYRYQLLLNYKKEYLVKSHWSKKYEEKKLNKPYTSRYSEDLYTSFDIIILISS